MLGLLAAISLTLAADPWDLVDRTDNLTGLREISTSQLSITNRSGENSFFSVRCVDGALRASILIRPRVAGSEVPVQVSASAPVSTDGVSLWSIDGFPDGSFAILPAADFERILQIADRSGVFTVRVFGQAGLNEVMFNTDLFLDNVAHLRANCPS